MREELYELEGTEQITQTKNSMTNALLPGGPNNTNLNTAHKDTQVT